MRTSTLKRDNQESSRARGDHVSCRERVRYLFRGRVGLIAVAMARGGVVQTKNLVNHFVDLGTNRRCCSTKNISFENFCSPQGYLNSGVRYVSDGV